MENKSAPKEPSLDTTYNPTEIEQPLYQHWEKNGYFKANGDVIPDGVSVVVKS